MSDTPRRGWITASVMLATIMQVLDLTIANVALPHMQGSLSATQTQVAWVLTSYVVAAAIMTPATGFLSARLGRKQLLLISISGFTVASALCGAATSLPEIIAFRILQGLFGATLVPLSQALLLDTYPKEQHGSAMALWGVGVMVGPILGPSLGGILTEYYNWRWVFYINVPLGLLALSGIAAFVKATPKQDRPFDITGFAYLTVAIGALQLMLDRGESEGWFTSPEVLTEAVLFIVGIYLFVVQTLTARKPFINPVIFLDRNFSVGLIFIFVLGIVLLATMALLPPFLQNLMGYSVLDTGYVLAPRGLGSMASMMMVGRLLGKVDARYMIFTGLLLIAYSLWDMTRFTTDVGTWPIVYTGVVQGVGLGLVFVPLNTLSFATLAPRFRDDGASLYSLMRSIGSSIGTSIVVTLFGRNTQVNHAVLSEQVTSFNAPHLPPAWQITDPTGVAALNAEVTRQAATIAYLDDFHFMMYVTLAAIPLLLLIRAPRRQPAAEAAEA